ncbi:hypothetical protein DCE79_02550 [Lysinibacillus sp. 2017]|uniref:hypothetical protein n=1 Tax=unclassified Lysinibacillus TaxID=2636778 RepID=UPI000D5259B2|nr:MULTISPECIES: hypothetical protein [unclassified Lysinibacillus]AWE06331.1 hypothetical protein DCE79_02550 [Lysinibacillus sp. 2017]TGN34992.1 hypothetical protein E4L99_11850 [Lysinibacillus sp. S2017]
MIFNFVVKYIFKAQTEADRLRASIIYGWALVGTIVTSICLLNIEIVMRTSPLNEIFFSLFFIALALLIFRYNSVKPMLGAASAGITVVAFTALFENIFSRRNDNSHTVGAIFGVLFVIVLLIMKNLIFSMYYLIRESIRYYQYKKNSHELENTVGVFLN